jgi:hypothetical protein
VKPATPIQLRDVTVRDYLRDSARLGQPMTVAEAERRARIDCDIYDAVMREQRPSTPAKPDPAAEARKAEALDVEAAAVGVEVDRGQVKMRRAPVAMLHKRHKRDSRAAFLKGRIARILEGSSRSTDFRVACSTATCPDLAYEIMTTYANAVTRGMPRRSGDEPNPFAGMSEVDTSRMMQAILEGIADRSSGRLGPWWVPK